MTFSRAGRQAAIAEQEQPALAAQSIDWLWLMLKKQQALNGWKKWAIALVPDHSEPLDPVRHSLKPAPRPNPLGHLQLQSSKS